MLAYDEVIDFIAAGPTPSAVAEFSPSDGTKAHVADLIHRQKTVGLADDEASELAHFLQIEHIMRLAKVRARQNLHE